MTAPLVDACYLAAGSCPDGYVSEGWAGVLGHQNTPFGRGGAFGGSWWWHHPQICCGPPGTLATNMYAMCPTGAYKIGHTHRAEYGDPYGNGGGFDGEYQCLKIWIHLIFVVSILVLLDLSISSIT